MPVITSLPQSCGIHRKVTSLLWVRSDLITWLWADKSRSSFSHDNFANNLVLSSSLEGNESGTVALVDTRNPESALSSTVHDRRITGFAFSAHRYSLIYWQGTCDYIHFKALFVFRVKNVRVLVLVFLSRGIIKNRVNQCLTFDMKCVNVQNTCCVQGYWPTHWGDFSDYSHPCFKKDYLLFETNRIFSLCWQCAKWWCKHFCKIWCLLIHCTWVRFIKKCAFHKFIPKFSGIWLF